LTVLADAGKSVRYPAGRQVAGLDDLPAAS
jgi:hypothetical protein